MSLLEGEEISLENLMDSFSSTPLDDEINEKYLRGEVRIVTEQARYPLTNIPSMLESGDYLLNPEFQRRHRWTITQKSKLIESFIINVPIPPIFLYEDKFSHYEVMDGLQRLTAIHEFYRDKFSLQDLELWPEVNGMKYSELPSQIQKGIDRRYLSSIILLQETAKNEIEAKRLKQLVFERINSGGVKLEPQESRNAIYNGPFNELCIILARNENFCRLWNIPIPTENEINSHVLSEELLKNQLYSNMTDVEIVLRFFANRQRQSLFKYGGTYKSLFDNYLKNANLFSETTINKLEDLFVKTINFIYDVFGEKAFYMYRKRNGSWNWYSRSTTAIYDPLMATASLYLEKIEEIKEKKLDIESLLIDFYKDNYDSFEGRNTNPGIIQEREEKFNKFFRTKLLV